MEEKTTTITDRVNNYDGNTKKACKAVHEVFNQLTRKSDILFNQINRLPIDTIDEILDVINWIFDRASNEPNLLIVYELICRKLFFTFPIKTAVRMDYINFRKLFVARCLREFETNSRKGGSYEEQIKMFSDPQMKKGISAKLTEGQKNGITLIVELCKQQILSMRVKVVANHLNVNIEEELEFLSALLTISGKELESRNVDLNPTFATLKDALDKTTSEVVRLKIMEVIDLRTSNWITCVRIPRVIYQRYNKEQRIQVLNSAFINADTSKKLTIQSNLLQLKQPPATTELLGSSSVIGAEAINSTPVTPRNNDGIVDKTIHDDCSVENFTFFIQSDEHKHKPPTVDALFKSDSQHGSDDNSQSITPRSDDKSQHITPRSDDNSESITPVQKVPAVKKQPTPPLKRPTGLTRILLERQIRNFLLEYLAGCSDINETDRDIKDSLPPSALKQLVSDTYKYVMDKPKKVRLNTGQFFKELIIRETLPIDTFCTALEKVFSNSESLTVNNPKIWDCYAELLVGLVIEDVLQLSRLHECCGLLISLGHAHNFLASLFKIIIEEKGPIFLLSLWNRSNLSLKDFMNSEQVNTFITSNNIHFLRNRPLSGQVQTVPRKLASLTEQNTAADSTWRKVTRLIDPFTGREIKHEEKSASHSPTRETSVRQFPHPTSATSEEKPSHPNFGFQWRTQLKLVNAKEENVKSSQVVKGKETLREDQSENNQKEEKQSPSGASSVSDIPHPRPNASNEDPSYLDFIYDWHTQLQSKSSYLSPPRLVIGNEASSSTEWPQQHPPNQAGSQISLFEKIAPTASALLNTETNTQHQSMKWIFPQQKVHPFEGFGRLSKPVFGEITPTGLSSEASALQNTAINTQPQSMKWIFPQQKGRQPCAGFRRLPNSHNRTNERVVNPETSIFNKKQICPQKGPFAKSQSWANI